MGIPRPHRNNKPDPKEYLLFAVILILTGIVSWAVTEMLFKLKLAGII